jgi:exodeoxyribonuclease X
MTRKIVVTDTETASIKGGIVDFAVIEIDENLEVIKTTESLIDPLQRIVPAAQAVHGITQEMVADSPTAAEYLFHFGNPVLGAEELIVFGHNVQFDCRMLTEAKFLPETYIKGCTLRMAKNQWPDLEDEAENHKLGTLAIMFGLETGPAHRAMGDAVTCLNLLRHIAGFAKVGSFDELLALGRRALSLDSKIGFGKHKGARLSALPKDYVSWLCKQPDMDQDLREALAPRLQ